LLSTLVLLLLDERCIFSPPYDLTVHEWQTGSDAQTYGPPENADVEIYKQLQKKISFTFPTKRWSNEERIELAKGVKQQVYEVLVMKAMDSLRYGSHESFSGVAKNAYVIKLSKKLYRPTV
jgi:hypothetical protein